MPPARLAAAVVFVASLAAGTLADRPPPQRQIEIGGYRVLAVDLHTHSSMWSDGALTPWGLVLEADRQGLDAIAITGHNDVFDGRLGRAFARAVSRVVVLPGEEILSDPDYHLIAIGVRERIGFRQRAADAIDAIHRQGGVAIAAHPIREFWRAYDAAAMQRLDGAEICHPLIYGRDGAQQELEAFAARAHVAAIGSSDAHGVGPMGFCRTFVFVRDATERGILDALRARRTVVFGRGAAIYGDPALVRIAGADARLRDAARPARAGLLDALSRIGGVLGLAGLLLF
jgi:predicted metal-dependent phosphoesterase TrpH